MSLFRVKYLSFFFILVSIFSFLNIIYSYYFNLYLNLNTYYFSLFSSLIIGLLFFKMKETTKKPTIFEKILTVFLGYILLPLVLSLPFYFSIYNLTFLNSIFESVSGTLIFKLPSPIEVEAKIRLFIDLKNLEENLIAIDIDMNNKSETIII